MLLEGLADRLFETFDDFLLHFFNIFLADCLFLNIWGGLELDADDGIFVCCLSEILFLVNNLALEQLFVLL